MARSKQRLLIIGFAAFFILMFMSSINVAQAQPLGEGWVEDERLHLNVMFDNISITNAPESNPIEINKEAPMILYLEVVVTNDVPLNMSGTIWFYYQGLPLIPIVVQNPVSNSSWVPIPNNYTMPPVEYAISFDEILAMGPGGIDIATGLFEASLAFSYYEVDPTDAARSSILYTLTQEFHFNIPADTFLEVITSVAGIVTTASTAGAVAGFGFNIKGLLDGIQTAHKVRSIQKKTIQIKSLPNLTVLGALPALFASVAGLVSLSKKKKKKKKKDAEPEDEATTSATSDYLLKQRLREVAPDAWPMDICPVCKKKWNKKENTCKKCHIDEDTARREYAELLVKRAERALKVLDKKKSLSIQKIAKKTKSNEYNAGVIGAAMVDTGFTEIQKIETPFRSFVMNIGGLIFLILTWQQLMGGASSEFQTTLTLVGGGLSLAVIIALYISRKTQIEKLHTEIDAGAKMMPTEEEREEFESGKTDTRVTPVEEIQPDADLEETVDEIIDADDTVSEEPDEVVSEDSDFEDEPEVDDSTVESEPVEDDSDTDEFEE